MMEDLRSVFEALATARPEPGWVEAARTIARERVLVDELVASGYESVYGFNTFFGPLDDRGLLLGQQADLLRAHLVGRPEELSSPEWTALLAVRTHETALGSTGCSPEAFDRLLSCWSQARGVGGVADLRASYSSGDVVPAAWLVRGWFGGTTLPRVGDAIALINGNFVSTGLALVAFSEVGLLLRRMTHMALSMGGGADVSTEGRPQDFERLVEHWGMTLPEASHDRVQRSVAQRDVMTSMNGVYRSLVHYAIALDERLSRPSGNPLFDFRAGRARVVSQSSFLGPELAFQTVALRRAVLFGASVIVRLASLRFEEKWTKEGDPKYVQRPKVALAKLLTASAEAGAFAGYTGAESGGVEDLWDYSLAEVNALRHLVGRIDEVLEMVSFQEIPDTPARGEDVLWSEGRGLVDFMIGGR